MKVKKLSPKHNMPNRSERIATGIGLRRFFTVQFTMSVLYRWRV